MPSRRAHGGADAADAAGDAPSDRRPARLADRPPPDGASVVEASPAHAPLADAWPVDAPLGALLTAMRSPVAAVREAAWAACYERYHAMVWTRALYVMRTVAWLAEPHEAAADVASDVFVGLPDAAQHYREEGRAEWWLKQIVVRTALRRREALTGQWSSGRRGTGAAGDRPVWAVAGRTYLSFDDAADDIVARLDAAEQDELLELQRRRAALRASADTQHRRWDAFLDLYVAGYDFREIGARMGLTEGTARNWLWKIRKHLATPASAAGAPLSARGGDHD